MWNPYYQFNSHVDFAKKNQRISYAASFGVDEIPEEKRETYAKWLKGIPNISVREEQGKKIVKELSGLEAEVLVDPTLLLSKEQWIQIAKKPKWLKNEKYILTYFLGEDSEKKSKSINHISDRYQLPIIKLNDCRLKKEYSTSPEEFIYLINNCELLCTDSFHGTIFAYQMNRPIIIYERVLMKGEVPMNSRMKMIEQLVGVENRVIGNVNIEDKENLFFCDYSEANINVEKEREKARIFLEKCLKK